MAEKKDPYDKTSSKRAAAHLARLADSKGKRLPVDLSALHIEHIQTLIAAGYAPTAAGVIRKAIEEAHARLPAPALQT
jgi:hypothetical protein